ncbi:MAG TPA: hypothetical protein VI585_17400, partial [Candidatus Binatia bacterium]
VCSDIPFTLHPISKSRRKLSRCNFTSDACSFRSEVRFAGETALPKVLAKPVTDDPTREFSVLLP